MNVLNIKGCYDCDFPDVCDKCINCNVMENTMPDDCPFTQIRQSAYEECAVLAGKKRILKLEVIG